MNAHLGALGNCFEYDAAPLGPQRKGELFHPGATFVFIDEHPDSISFIQFSVYDGSGPDGRLRSYPGTSHRDGATLSFVDGHAELHSWRDARTRLEIRHARDHQWPAADAPSPHNPDVEWLLERTGFRRP